MVPCTPNSIRTSHLVRHNQRSAQGPMDLDYVRGSATVALQVLLGTTIQTPAVTDGHLSDHGGEPDRSACAFLQWMRRCMMAQDNTPLRRYLSMTTAERRQALIARRRAVLPPEVEELRRELIENRHIYAAEADEALQEMAQFLEANASNPVVAQAMKRFATALGLEE